MFSCQCCLRPHPKRLLERYNASVQTIKLIHKNSSIFEGILLDEYEHLERISSNLNKYIMQYGPISHSIFSSFSQLIVKFNTRLENLSQILYELECLTVKCFIWLKNYSIKQIRSRLKHSQNQFRSLEHFAEQNPHLLPHQNSLTKKFWTDFSTFQSRYRQQCLQMDSIECEHIKLVSQAYQIFSSIILPGNQEKSFSTINIEENIREWKEQHRFHVRWLPNEHHAQDHQAKLVGKVSSDITIQAIDNCSTDSPDKYVHESNLSWSFTSARRKEDASMLAKGDTKSSQPAANIIKSLPMNRVRLAIEAIERNSSKHFPRGRKS